MNSNEREALRRLIAQVRPADIEVSPVSSISGSNGIRSALKNAEATAARFQKSGSEVLLLVVKR